MNNSRGPSGPFFMLCIFLLALMGTQVIAQTTTELEIAAAIHRESNEVRTSKKRSELVRNSTADSLAYAHALNMAKGKVRIGHKGFEQRGDYLLKLGAEAVYENVWYGWNVEPISCLNDWLKSSNHRKNLLQRDVNQTGLGVAINQKKEVFVCVLYLLAND